MLRNVLSGLVDYLKNITFRFDRLRCMDSNISDVHVVIINNNLVDLGNYLKTEVNMEEYLLQ